MGHEPDGLVQGGRGNVSMPVKPFAGRAFKPPLLPKRVLDIAGKVGPDISTAISGRDSVSSKHTIFLSPSCPEEDVPSLRRLPISRSISTTVYLRSKPLVRNDLTEVRYSEEKELKKIGFNSYVAVPVDLEGWDRATVLFTSRTPHRFDALTIGALMGHVEEWLLVEMETDTEADQILREGIMTNDRVTPPPETVVGESPEFLEICRLIAIVARQDTTVLMQGESGTGKELLAKTLYRYSSRKDKPFVRVNCAAITETLLESEMFGHRKGAFTGAIDTHKGRFEIANGGTLLLDEIGNMSLTGQAKLLRVLQEFEFEPVGQSASVKVDVRVIATTNVDLANSIEKGRFREDLFYRLAVATITIPPLRKRRTDIPLLAEHFLRIAAASRRRPHLTLSEETRSILFNYDWPGNVRELRNVIDYAVLVAKENVIKPGNLPATVTQQQAGNIAGGSRTLKQRTDRYEKKLILDALHCAKGVRKEAARMLGVDPRNLNYFLKKHDIE